MASKAEIAKREQKKKDRQAGPGTTRPSTAAAAPEVSTAGQNLRKIKVMALRMGYYQHKRRREGDVFFLVALRTVKRATQEDCDADKTGKLKIGMILKDPKTKKEIPVIKTPEEQFSDKWMERVDDDVPTRITAVKEGMKAEHDRILRDKYPDLAGEGNGASDDDPAADSGEGIDDGVVGDDDADAQNLEL
jgi:hypothetical protein